MSDSKIFILSIILPAIISIISIIYQPEKYKKLLIILTSILSLFLIIVSYSLYDKESKNAEALAKKINDTHQNTEIEKQRELVKDFLDAFSNKYISEFNELHKKIHRFKYVKLYKSGTPDYSFAISDIVNDEFFLKQTYRELDHKMIFLSEAKILSGSKYDRLKEMTILFKKTYLEVFKPSNCCNIKEMISLEGENEFSESKEFEELHKFNIKMLKEIHLTRQTI